MWQCYYLRALFLLFSLCFLTVFIVLKMRLNLSLKQSFSFTGSLGLLKASSSSSPWVPQTLQVLLISHLLWFLWRDLTMRVPSFFLIKEFCFPQARVYQLEQVYPHASYRSSFMTVSLSSDLTWRFHNIRWRFCESKWMIYTVLSTWMLTVVQEDKKTKPTPKKAGIEGLPGASKSAVEDSAASWQSRVVAVR